MMLFGAVCAPLLLLLKSIPCSWSFKASANARMEEEQTKPGVDSVPHSGASCVNQAARDPLIPSWSTYPCLRGLWNHGSWMAKLIERVRSTRTSQNQTRPESHCRSVRAIFGQSGEIFKRRSIWRRNFGGSIAEFLPHSKHQENADRHVRDGGKGCVFKSWNPFVLDANTLSVWTGIFPNGMESFPPFPPMKRW